MFYNITIYNFIISETILKINCIVTYKVNVKQFSFFLTVVRN